MFDDERKTFDPTNIEELLQQIEESLTHSRVIIDQIDMVRQLRLRVGAPNPLPPRALPLPLSDF